MLSPAAMAGDGTSSAIGFVKEHSYAYRSMSACHGGEGKTLFPRMMMVVVGSFHCKPAYGDAKDYLVGFYGQQRFYVESSAVWVADERRATLPQLDEDQLASQDFSSSKDESNLYRHLGVSAALKAYDAPAKHGVSVLDFSVYDESEYTEATGFKLRVYNPTKKTIKYIRVEVVGINAVNDPVRDRFSGSAVKRVRGIGPIEPEDFGSYTFENLWFTDEVEWPRLVSLKVDYMDGSSKTIKNLKLVKVDQKHQDVMAWEDD